MKRVTEAINILSAMESGKMYIGWIAAGYLDKGFLEELGIKVGSYNHEENEFENCLVSEDALYRLDKYWGDFFWGLTKLQSH